jgi:hypothetical protein
MDSLRAYFGECFWLSFQCRRASDARMDIDSDELARPIGLYAPEIIAVILVIGTLAGVLGGVLSWHP